TNDNVHVSGGTVILHDTDIKLSANRNVFMNNGSLTIDDGSTITNATHAGIEFAGGANDILRVGAATGAQVEVSANFGHGINLTGPGTTMGTIAVQRTNILNNALDGIHIDLTGNANGISFLNDTVSGNQGHGIVDTGAPVSTAGGIVFDNVDVPAH